MDNCVNGTVSYTTETPLHINKDIETMIFPQLPKRVNYTNTVTTAHDKTPLHIIQTTLESSEPVAITVQEWWIRHGLATDPAALNYSKEPIDWSSRESWEFYMIVCAFVCWTAYWLGVHRGAW